MGFANAFLKQASDTAAPKRNAAAPGNGERAAVRGVARGYRGAATSDGDHVQGAAGWGAATLRTTRRLTCFSHRPCRCAGQHTRRLRSPGIQRWIAQRISRGAVELGVQLFNRKAFRRLNSTAILLLAQGGGTRTLPTSQFAGYRPPAPEARPPHKSTSATLQRPCAADLLTSETST